MSTTENDDRIALAIKLPPIFHEMLKELASTGLYCTLESCVECAGTEGEFPECSKCGGDGEYFEQSPEAAAAELLQNVMRDKIASGGFKNLTGKTGRDLRKAVT